MKKRLLLPLALLLAACNGQNLAKNPSTEELLQNPLYADRYTMLMVDVFVEMEIQEDPILEDENMRKKVLDLKNKWHNRALAARAKRREGMMGNFIPMEEYAAGEVLLVDNTLYIGPEFETMPGPSLKLYLTTEVDPRDVEFPDKSALDLGVLPSPFGASSFPVNFRQEGEEVPDPLLYRTAVLWDTELERLYGFAQLSP